MYLLDLLDVYFDSQLFSNDCRRSRKRFNVRSDLVRKAYSRLPKWLPQDSASFTRRLSSDFCCCTWVRPFGGFFSLPQKAWLGL